MLIPRALVQSRVRHLLVRQRRQQPILSGVSQPGNYQSHVRWTSQSREQPQESERNKVQNGKQDQIEGLPAPGEGGIKLDVSGEGSSVSLGHLGPLVVNRDGTTGRVSNWETMTVHEKDTTMTLLKKRNKARLDALKKDEETKS